MNKHSSFYRGLAIVGVATLASLGFAPAVSAQAAGTSASQPQTYQVNLAQSNSSGASGTATLTLTGTSLRVSVRGTGFSANLPHATHIHVGGQAACPSPAAADANKDGYVDVKEAEKFVGPMKVSLTTSGDTTDKSALATDRMPKADGKGALTYDRTFNLPTGVSAADMAKASVDIHGISSLFNDKAKYDGDKKSELDNKLPFETTVPAACGVLSSTPVGGAATGSGATEGIESPALFAVGAASLVAAIVIALAARKHLVAGE